MTRSISTLLTSSDPVVAAPAKVTIGHMYVVRLDFVTHLHLFVCAYLQGFLVSRVLGNWRCPHSPIVFS